MHPLFEFCRQDVVNHPVLRDPGLALKRRSDNFDAEMAFPVWPGAGMVQCGSGLRLLLHIPIIMPHET